jgi:hypothetical protein
MTITSSAELEAILDTVGNSPAYTLKGAHDLMQRYLVNCKLEPTKYNIDKIVGEAFSRFEPREVSEDDYAPGLYLTATTEALGQIIDKAKKH